MKRLCCFLTGLLFAITPVHAFNDGAPRTAYSTAYPYVRLFLPYSNTIPFGTAWAFTSADAVSDLFGNTSQEYAVAQDAFSGPNSGAATVLFARFVPGQGRGRIYGGNLNGNITLGQIQALDGDTLSVIENGQTVSITYPSSGRNAPSGISDACPPGGSPTANCLYALARITTTLFNTAQPTNATLSSSTIAPGAGASFTGSIRNSILSVTAVTSGTIQIGGQITTSSGYKGNIAGQITGPGGCEPVGSGGCTAGGIGAYNSVPFVSASVPDGTSITEGWGVLTVGSVGLSDTMNSGDQITGSGTTTYLAANLGSPGLGTCTGSACNGSTWTVWNSQTIASGTLAERLAPIICNYEIITGNDATVYHLYLERTASATYLGYNNVLVNPPTMTYATGTAASTLLLDQPTTVNYPTTAYLSSPGEMVMDPGYWMTNTMLKLSTQWFTFQLVGDTNPVIKGILKNWANSQPNLPYRFLWQYNLTTPGI